MRPSVASRSILFARPLAVVLMVGVLVLPRPALASHIGASTLTLSDTGIGATSTYTLAYQIGGGNGNLAAGQPTLRITFPGDTDVSGAGFDVAASGICECASGTVAGPYGPFPDYAVGGGFAVDVAGRVVTIGPLDVATVAGQTAFRVVLTGIVNSTSDGSASLGAMVTNAAGSTNTSGSVSFTLTGASAATGPAGPVGATTATLAGTSTAAVGVDITRRGMVLALASDALPEVDAVGSVTIDASSPGAGPFEVVASDLEPEATYRFRAFIFTVGGVQYGLAETFTTTEMPPPTPSGAASSVRPASLSCAPDPVVAGGTLTCTLTDGVPDVEVLWRAIVGDITLEGVVVADASGTGSFTLAVPLGPGETLAVELVDWTAPLVVAVSPAAANPMPSTIPAGGGPRPLQVVALEMLMLALLALVLTAGVGGPLGMSVGRLRTVEHDLPVLPAATLRRAQALPAFDALAQRLEQRRAEIRSMRLR